MSMSLIATILIVILAVQLIETLSKGTAEIARTLNEEHERKCKEELARNVQWRRSQMTDAEKIADSARSAKWFAENNPHVYYNFGNRPLPTGEERVRLDKLVAEAEVKAKTEAEALRKI